MLKNPILFADFIDVNDESVARLYKPVNDVAKLTKILEELCRSQNADNSQVCWCLIYFDISLIIMTNMTNL